MRRNMPSKPKAARISIPGFFLQNTIRIPMAMTSLVVQTGDRMLNRSMEWITGKNQDARPKPSHGKTHNQKTGPFGNNDPDLQAALGLRPYGPKIYIRD